MLRLNFTHNLTTDALTDLFTWWRNKATTHTDQLFPFFPLCSVLSLHNPLLLSHTLFLWALKSDGSAFCAERDASCRLMLCLLFWAGSQRAVVVRCCFSIHASTPLFLPWANSTTRPPFSPTPTLSSTAATIPGLDEDMCFPQTTPALSHTHRPPQPLLSAYLSLLILVSGSLGSD